jgi:hypothetical protein
MTPVYREVPLAQKGCWIEWGNHQLTCYTLKYVIRPHEQARVPPSVDVYLVQGEATRASPLTMHR